MALVLAGVGVYGVMAYLGGAAHARDRRPHGARRDAAVCVPAGPREGLRLVVIGVTAGLVAAVALDARADARSCSTPTPRPWTLAITALVLTVVALAAASVPARRGTRIAPIQALRVQ